MKKCFLQVFFLAFVFLPLYGLSQNGVPGTKVICAPIVKMTTGQLMEHWMPIVPAELKRRNIGLGLKEPDRENLPQAPGALELSQWPTLQSQNLPEDFTYTDAPQTYGVNFTGAVLSDALAFPPDVMGAVGPTQFIVFVNGRIRSFNKTTGIADGVLNIDPDVFFSLVTTPPGAGEVTFTSDPNVRYDRLTGRWFLTIIDVTQNTTTGSVRANRNLFAWSDGPIISGSTSWTFTYFQNTTYFDDYPSLGIDADAIYVGTNRFSAGVGGSLINMVAYVWNKASFISGSPSGYIWTLYDGTTGTFSPRGVDNLDPANTGPTAVGYFIGVDVINYGLLILNRVTNPAGAPPTMSSNISLTVATTNAPVKVPHLGNTAGNNGRLDALDDRLFAAQIKNGRLWTAHNVGVRNDGVSSTTSNSRNGARWYELSNLNGTPTIFQSGTLYDNSGTATSTTQRNYWIPSIAVSGQGHAALGCSIAGTNERVNAFTTGRLSGDPLGTLRNGPGGSSILGYTTSTTAYNPTSDPGGAGGRRWGDYSFTCVDPNDDMTMWTVQQYCDATNSWGVRVLQLIAPPPATPSSCSPSQIESQQTVNVVVNGSSTNGSGFFDPGSDLGGPGFLNRISASIPNITVNSITYNSPTQVTLNLTIGVVPAGLYNITITNPDGQSATGVGILQIDDPLPVELSSFSAAVIGKDVKLSWNTATEINNYGFEIERSVISNGVRNLNWEKIGFVNGNGTSNSPKSYSFVDDKVNAGKYSYRLKQIDNDGQFEYSKTIEVDVNGVKEYKLTQNYPNPFNPATTIQYILPQAGNVKLTLYNILGQEIRTLVNEMKEAGTHTINIDASDLNSGMYIYKIESGSFVQTRKMTLVK
jgi:hypothetical protein